MFGNVTALEGLHVTGKYRAHNLQACGLGSSHETTQQPLRFARTSGLWGYNPG